MGLVKSPLTSSPYPSPSAGLNYRLISIETFSKGVKKSKLIFRGVELPPRSVQSVKDQLYSFNDTASPITTAGCKWSTLLSLFRRCLAKIGSQHPHIQIPLLLNGVSKSAPLLSLPAALLLTVLPPGIFLTHKSKAISYNT